MTFPVTTPGIVGLYATVIVQLAPPARLDEQVFAVRTKSPLATIEPMATAPEPIFVNVTAFPALVSPSGRLPKKRPEVDNLITDWIVKLVDFVASTLPATSTLWNVTV